MGYILYHVLAFGLLSAACWAAGSLLARRLPNRHTLGGLEPLATICLGLAGCTLATFLLSALGLMRPAVVRTLLALLLIGALAVGLRDGWRPAPRRWLPAGGPIAFSALLTALLAPFLLLALTPTVSWDASAYHLRLPELFLAAGGFRPVPFSVYSHWPLGVELLFTAAMALADYVVAKLVHFGFGVLTLYAIYAGCRTFHRPASGRLAILLFLANGVVAYELRVAYVDLAHAFYFTAAVLFMLRALAAPEQARTSLWLSGLCAGLTAGVKVTGIAGAAIVGALYVPRLTRALRDGRLRPVLGRFVASFGLPVAVLWAPWLIKAAWYTGNPAYPFFHRWLGGPDWSQALTGQFQTWQSSIGMGRELLDYLLLPVRVILAGGEGYGRFDGEIGAFWIVLVPLALWQARSSALVRRCLAGAGLTFAVWALSSQQMRFLIPALPLLAIAGAVSVVELLGRLPGARRRRAGRVLAIAAMVAFLVSTQARVLAAGFRTLGVYLSVPGDLKSTAVHPVYTWVNTRLPPDAKLLFLNTNQSFFCQREVIADSFFEASQIADWLAPAGDVAELRALLSARGVTHVLVENRPRGIAYPPALQQMLNDQTRVTPLYRSEDGRFSVLELRAAEDRLPG